MSTARVEPRVTWPRSVVAGEPFLVCVDLALVDAGEQPWPFEEEEKEFTCVLDGARHFRVEAVHDASVVMHRFGGTYGPAQFVVVAQAESGLRSLRLTAVTSRGVVMGSVDLPVSVGTAGAGGDGELRSVDLVRKAGSGDPGPSSGRSALCIVVGRYSVADGLEGGEEMRQTSPFSDLPGVYAAGQRVVEGLSALGYECTELIDPVGRELHDRLRGFLLDDDASLRVVYYVGHGVVRHRENFYLTATDAGDGRPGSEGTISFGLLADIAHSREGPPALFLLDACHSGAAALSPEMLGRGRSRPYLVTSSGSEEMSFDGVFSHSVADVLEQAATGQLYAGEPGEAVPLSTVVEEIHRHMQERTPRLQTVTSNLTVPRPPDPAFIPVLAPADAGEHDSRSSSLQVMGVHGGAQQQRSPQSIALDWLSAIQDGLRQADLSLNASAIDLSIAYYADLTAQSSAPVPAPDRESEGPRLPAGGQGTAPGADGSEETWSPSTRRWKTTSLLRPALDYLALLAESTASRPFQKMLLASLQEVSRYFRPENREAVTARVHHAILDTQPRVVLAHSLGSVVAYEALWREPYPQVDVLVTMGSLLALTPVQERLTPPEHRKPPGVSQWVDITAASDTLTVPRSGVARTFLDVRSIRIDSDTSNPHAVSGYLRSTAVAGVLADLLPRSQT